MISIMFLLILFGYGQIGYYSSVWCTVVQKKCLAQENEGEARINDISGRVNAWLEAEQDRDD